MNNREFAEKVGINVKTLNFQVGRLLTELIAKKQFIQKDVKQFFVVNESTMLDRVIEKLESEGIEIC